ncbi:hypothetical protein VST7929_01705 [Vibrio stylophorae]|uniref:Methyl-accepting transducer domain-containing protein n=1 Tax=Vibrio stylophorae TaxID=659351 RepID=A0ABM8ZU49_9VIBR|nr:methyl-accepting chemotaxis protein [Vibrio stylophorae]CAH0533830.1 hypothetical protein VST7929_01705 [Vibrio stylophorae]
MKYLTQLKVRTRLALGFSIIVALMILLTTIGIQKVNFIDSSLSKVTDINSVKQRYAINYRGSVHDRAIAIRDLVMAKTPQEISSIEKDIQNLSQYYQASAQKMQAMLDSQVPFTAEEIAILNQISHIQGQTQPLIETVMTKKNRGEAIPDTLLNQIRPKFKQWLEAINQFIDYQEQLNQKLTPIAREQASGFQNLMLILSSIAIVISILVGFVIERSFHFSLGGEPYTTQHEIQAMANGVLKQNHHNTVFGSILHSLSIMSEKLSAIVRHIRGTSEQLVEQVEQVSMGSNSVYESAQQQAALTDEMVIKLETMHATTQEIASIMNLSEQNSVNTSNHAHEGKVHIAVVAEQMQLVTTAVNDTVDQIKTLEEKTRDIGGIVHMISSISEQTNLLALNAAIEAARAGESGRGFAVVADEVRNLAKRTGEATTQIEAMLKEVQIQTVASVSAMENTQPKVEHCQQSTTEASQLLVHIEQQAQDSLNQVRHIVHATDEQVKFIQDLVVAMEQISSMSTESIQLMKNNQSATHQLNALSSHLTQEVAFFKV